MDSTPSRGERDDTPGLLGAIRHVVSFVLFTFRRFIDDRLGGAVAALTYTTLLAIVPLMVIAFAILSSFPAFDSVQRQLEGLIYDAVVPETGVAIREYLVGFTRNAGDLTSLGVVALAVTALFLLSTIESTLNQVWHVEHPRPILMRFLMFWAVLTLGPLLIGVSITLTSDILHMVREALFGTGEVPFVTAISETSGVLNTLLSVVITTIGFTALFVLVPARQVRVLDAAIGGAFAAVAFEVLASSFNAFILSGRTYETIYGAVVAVPVFLVWIYTSWMVIIFGAVVAASLPDWRATGEAGRALDPGPTGRLELALRLLGELYRQSRTGGTIPEAELTASLPSVASQEVLDDLRDAGYLVTAEDGGVSLARDLHLATVSDLAADILVAHCRASGRAKVSVTNAAEADQDHVDRLLARLNAAEQEVLGISLASVFGEAPGGDNTTKSTGRA